MLGTSLSRRAVTLDSLCPVWRFWYHNLIFQGEIVVFEAKHSFKFPRNL